MFTRTIFSNLACALLPSWVGNSLRRYPSGRPKNLAVNLHYESNGGFFSTSHAYASIHNIKEDCSTHYEGWVKLDEGSNDIGLAVGQPTQLVIKLSHSSWSGDSGGSMERGVGITPKPGMHYEVDVNYADAMYDIRLFPMGHDGKQRLKANQCPARLREALRHSRALARQGLRQESALPPAVGPSNVRSNPAAGL